MTPQQRAADHPLDEARSQLLAGLARGSPPLPPEADTYAHRRLEAPRTGEADLVRDRMRQFQAFLVERLPMPVLDDAPPSSGSRGELIPEAIRIGGGHAPESFGDCPLPS